MQHDFGLPLMLRRGRCAPSPIGKGWVRDYGFSEVPTPSPGAVWTTLAVAVSADLSRRGEVRQQWVPCGCGGVKADHLVPSQMRAACWALPRSSGLNAANASSSMG